MAEFTDRKRQRSDSLGPGPDQPTRSTRSPKRPALDSYEDDTKPFSGASNGRSGSQSTRRSNGRSGSAGMAAASADDSQSHLDAAVKEERDDGSPVASTSAGAALPAAPAQSSASTDPSVDKPAPTLSMRSLIVTQDASIIIGKGGQNIAQIRERSGAKVNVSENVAGNPERVLTVSGALDTVARVRATNLRRS